jgi:hypothetical protein
MDQTSDNTERTNERDQYTKVSRDFVAPLGQIEHARLEIVRGISKATISAHPMAEDLFRAHFEGSVPQVSHRENTVRVAYPVPSLLQLAGYMLGGANHSAHVTLNGAIIWQIIINGGAFRVMADLRQLNLQAFEVRGGASNVELMLPQPLGTVTVRVTGGASSVSLHRPVGVAASIYVASGASSLTLDQQHYGAIGGSVHLETPDYLSALNRYQIEVMSGASNLSIDTL